jgi:hypothetical protein
MSEELAHAIGATVLAQGLGALGAALGIWTLVRSIQADRVHLVVKPVIRWRVPGGLITVSKSGLTSARMDALGPPFLCVNVVNYSKFKVTVDEVGLCEGSSSKGARRGFVYPELDVGDAVPAALEPRGKVTIAAPLEVWDTVTVTPRTRVYATTDCDHESARHDPFLGTCFEMVSQWLRGARQGSGR